MNRTVGALAIALCSALVIAATRPGQAATPAASAPTSQPAYPLWDGNENVPAYAKRAGIKQTERVLGLGNGITLKMILIPAGKNLMGVPNDEFAMIAAVRSQPGSPQYLH